MPRCRAAYKEVSKALRARLPGLFSAELEPALARVPQRVKNPVARLRQFHSEWQNVQRRSINTSARHGKKSQRTSYNSVTWSTIKRSSGVTPFASTLRPNLTGGALGRTSGGYNLGSGRVNAQRYFSHGPACQAQVVQNVSQAMRAFIVGGNRAQYSGTSNITGEKRFRTISKFQQDVKEKIYHNPVFTPGSTIKFKINPTITAFTFLKPNTTIVDSEQAKHINSEGLLDILSSDFSRSLKELSLILSDLASLTSLGDLPLTYCDNALMVHFPGCDAESVNRLCKDLSLKRAIVEEDEDFATYAGTEIALLFPSAPLEKFSAEPYEAIPPSFEIEPIDWQGMLSPIETIAYSTRSVQDIDDHSEDTFIMSASDSLSLSQRCAEECSIHTPREYEGIEGIYRFIEQCDNVRSSRMV